MLNIQEKIKKQIRENKIIVYMKGNPETPSCGFSANVINILNNLNIKYVYVDVIKNQEIRKELPKISHWPTFPQIFLNGVLIGGSDIITELYENKKLEDLINKQLGT